MPSNKVECTCLAEKERQETARTGFIKFVHFEEGYDEDGNPCPLHDPREQKMADGSAEQIQAARRERGEQLRALIVSWDEDKTFLLALNEQQDAISAGEIAPSDDWGAMADELLGQYMSVRAQKTAAEEEKKDDGPKLILP